MMKLETILAIESAVSGGSLALTIGRTVRKKWHNAAGSARSEELLPRIADLLESSGINKSELSRIAVSNGPGSYTGIRIGLATAMGLARSLKVPCTGVSLQNAIAADSDETGEKITVVPVGREAYCWKIFTGAGEKNTSGETATGRLPALLELLHEQPETAVIAHNDVYRQIVASGGAIDRPGPVIDYGRDLAVAVSFAAEFTDDGLSPFYASNVFSGVS